LRSSTTDQPAEAVPEADAPTVDVTMPETGSEAGTTLVAWLVEPGQQVELDEPICLVSWDGTTAEIGSPATGVLRMLSVGAGVTVPTGTSLALIDTRLVPRVEAPAPAPEVQAAPEPEPKPEPEPVREPAPAGEFDPVPEQLLRDAPVGSPEEADLTSFHSPAVRRLAAELGVDLDEIRGTGLNGRITLRDVRAHAPTGVKSGHQA
jgi:pyruvate dehydrogenase E2 component (dihydrolipoamide acetyltransferase)